MKNETVEQRLPYVKEAVEQWFPPSIEAVKKRFPSTNEAVEQWFPHANEAFEQRLPHANGVVEKRLPHSSEAVERGLPHDDAAVEQELPPRANGAVENGLSRRDEGEASSSESDTSPWLSRSARSNTWTAPRVIEVASLRRDAKSITSLTGLSWKNFLRDLKAGDIEQSAEPKSAREERFAAQSWESLKASGDPIYETAREFADVFPDKTPAELPADRDERHEIDLAPGSKYCVTRQWSLPRDQVKAIDDFFEGRRQAGHVRESISPHSSPTFCVKKATGGWRIVHAFNKLNDATIPAQTPIPRKDMVLDSMSGSVIYSAIDLTDGIYQILMRESDIPLRAVSTPSGMLWEWLVMPQGLKNAHATFNCMVSHVLHPQSR
ncbi:hypothetical protein PR002_g19080 [Phytophthora rubi]|uniref:Reverse transcriptase domain-containing protein n=1 Tax=Phytophthora rubi TaxID=129364 RepID=A0A6A3JVA6_9STRA|nr:hypothetical protein PR002_g19080 [Phytophthora rubi]